MGCNDPLAYVPDEHTIDQVVRINVHFMCSEDNEVGFKDKKGREYMYYLIKNANKRLRENHKMELPVNNKTPNLQPQYQYRLTGDQKEKEDGYYWHNDDELYYFINKGKNRNNYSRDVIEKYENGGDSILNIFVMPHHPDSVISKSYKPFGTGIALGNSLKIAGLVEHPEKPWEYATLLNHEVGHIFGLSHTWSSNDGCDDTPKHPNCWFPDGKNGCEGPTSNNMMDYNHSQMAITPCQLGIVHKNFARLDGKVRKFLVPQWCNLDPSSRILIQEDTHWYGGRDVNHHITIASGASLYIHCRLSMPKAGQIIVEPGGKLVVNDAKIHNSCGDQWNGIKLLKHGSKQGQLEITGKSTIENISK